MKKKALGWIILVLVLTAGVALAGTTLDSGNHSVSELADNTDCEPATTIRIDTTKYVYSVTGQGELTFTMEGEDHFLVLDHGSLSAVSADGEIQLQGVSVLWPEGGHVAKSGGKYYIVDKSGTPAGKVVLGPEKGWRAVGKSSVSTTELEYSSLLILQDTTIILDEKAFVGRIYDPLREKKVTVAKGTCAGYLSIGDYHSVAVDVGSFTIDSGLTITNPRYGTCKDGQVIGSDGAPAVNVRISRQGKYKITTDGCFTETDYLALDTADAGDLVTVHSNGTSAGTYMSGVSSADVTVTLEEKPNGEIQFSFTMPAKDISLKAVISSQIPYTFRLGGKKEIPDRAEIGLASSLKFLGVHSAYYYADGKYHYDLDNDGTTDLISDTDYHFSVADTCSLAEGWTSGHLSGEKYSPLTFLFKAEPTPPADPAPPTGPAEPSNVTVGALKYRLSGTKAIVIGAKSKSAKSLTIPADISVGGKTYKVTEIQTGALKKMKKLTTVTIGKNVKTIGKNAFNGATKLKTVKGGKGVVTIKDSAFSGCAALKTFPTMSKLETVGANAFKGCKKLTKFTLDKKVKSIGKNAFNGCAALKTITVKTEKLTTKNVGAGAFKGISRKATFKCPKKKLKAYKTLFVKKGAPKTCKFQ